MDFKICVIGCGYMANAGHGPACRKYADENPGVKLSACCDMDPEKALSFSGKFSFERHYTDYVEMIEKEKPDAVLVLVPPKVIAAVAVDVLKMGVAAFIEKPPGLTVEEVKSIEEASRKFGKPAKVAFNRRFMPVITELKKRLAGSEGGQPVQADLIFYRKGRHDRDFSTTAIHGIDTLSFVMGSDYSRVNFAYNNRNTLLYCEFESGADATASFRQITGADAERIYVSTGKDLFLAHLPAINSWEYPGELVHIRDNVVVERISGIDLAGTDEMYITNGFWAENKAFFDHLRFNAPMGSGISDALQPVEIAGYIRNRAEEYRKG